MNVCPIVKKIAKAIKKCNILFKMIGLRTNKNYAL